MSKPHEAAERLRQRGCYCCNRRLGLHDRNKTLAGDICGLCLERIEIEQKQRVDKLSLPPVAERK